MSRLILSVKIHFKVTYKVSVSSSFVSAPIPCIRDVNPQALVGGLSPVHIHRIYNNFLFTPACISLCAL